MALHNEFGKRAEEAACNYLRQQGYRIMARNYRFDNAEIDLICTKGNTNIFVEVKARASTYYGQPEEAVTTQKEQHLLRAADQYIEENKLKGEYRFDIISITSKHDEMQIRHIPDAFFPTDDQE